MTVSKEYEAFCKKCNNEVKICQTCYFFKPIVFDYEIDDYYDEELGIFSLWVWSGYCMNESMPNIFPAFYHETKSNKKCEWYITKKEYELLIERFPGRELSYVEYKHILEQIRKELVVET